MIEGDPPKPRNRDMATMVAAAAPKTATRNRGVLTLLSGADVGRVVSVPIGGLRLGRSDDCEVSFDDASLSRVHARLLRIGDRFAVSDEGSTNGTFVNGTRMKEGSEIKDGDRIQLGTDTFVRFSIVDEVEESAMKRVFEAGRTDGLTGVANRKALEERLDSEVSFALRHSSPLSLVMLDVDHFKKVNDGYGHPAGDAVLRGVGTLLARRTRAEDFLARYGGEEFALIVRGVEVFGACVVADRLRMEVGAQPVEFEGKSIVVTMSAGIASLECCGKSADKASLVGLADKRLYAAKQAGRNRVVGES